MELRVRLTAPCKEVWRKLHIDVQKSLKAALKKLARRELQGKELTNELVGYKSLTVDNHRAIYRVINDMILVFHVGHRKDVYKQASRALASADTRDLEPI